MKYFMLITLFLLNSCSSSLNPYASQNPDYLKLIAAVTNAIRTRSNANSPTQTSVSFSTGTVASIGTPFDINQEDLVGPSDHYTNYGATPQLVLYSNSDGSLDIAWQNQTDKTRVVVTKLNSSFVSTGHMQVSSLGGFAGFSKDDSGNYYILTANMKDIGDSPSPDNIARNGIVALAKITPSYSAAFTTDLKIDPAANASGIDLIHIFNPMTAGSSRIMHANGVVLSLFSKNTGYDSSISRRHQNAVFGTVQSSDGVEIKGKNGYSHSFDQRIIYDKDNSRFVALELGDAYDRVIGLTTYSISGTTATKKTYRVFHIKGTLGQNYTYTRLGSVVNTASGYLVLFSSESDPTVPSGLGIYPMNLALVRMTKSLAVAESTTTNANYDSTFGGVDFAVTSSSKSVTNKGVKWLTSYSAISSGSAERPRLVPLSDSSIIVLWEEWKVVSSMSSYTTTKAMLIDLDGNILKAATDIGKVHLSRADDVIPICNSAATCLEAGWISGDKTNKALKLYKLDKSLNLTTVTIN